MAKATLQKRPVARIVAGAVGSLATGILAPLFSPVTGIVLAAVAIVLWAVSVFPAGEWVRARFREAPVASGVTAVLFLGLAIFTATQAVRVCEREWGAQKPVCGNTGPAIANGTGNVAISGCGNDVGKSK